MLIWVNKIPNPLPHTSLKLYLTDSENFKKIVWKEFQCGERSLLTLKQVTSFGIGQPGVHLRPFSDSVSRGTTNWALVLAVGVGRAWSAPAASLVGPSRVSLQSHSFLPTFCFSGSLLLFSSSWPICVFSILLPCSYSAVWMWSSCLFNDPLALTYLFTYMYWYMYLCFFRFFSHLGCYITWAEVLCYVVGPCCLSIFKYSCVYMSIPDTLTPNPSCSYCE